MTMALLSLEGRALDRSVGEQVFGFQIYHYDKGYPSECYWQLMDDEFDPVILPRKSIHDGQRATEAEAWDDCPKFSTEWEATIRVIEAIRGRPKRTQIAFLKALRAAIAERTGMPARAIPRDGVMLVMEPVDICCAALATVGEVPI